MRGDPFLEFLSVLEKEGFEVTQNSFIKPDLAFVLATVGQAEKPTTRVLYLKKFTGNEFVFFTHEDSKKGEDIAFNENVSACIFFPASLRQIRIEGRAVIGKQEEANEYWETRQALSKAGGILSKQSQILPNYEEFVIEAHKLAEEKSPLLKPETWVSYHIIADEFEFWEGAPNRLNLRTKYKKDLNFKDSWFKTHLYP